MWGTVDCRRTGDSLEECSRARESTAEPKNICKSIADNLGELRRAQTDRDTQTNRHVHRDRARELLAPFSSLCFLVLLGPSWRISLVLAGFLWSFLACCASLWSLLVSFGPSWRVVHLLSCGAFWLLVVIAIAIAIAIVIAIVIVVAIVMEIAIAIAMVSHVRSLCLAVLLGVLRVL